MSWSGGPGMGELRAFCCDVCGERRREVNHWWIVWIESASPRQFCAVTFDPSAWDRISQRAGAKDQSVVCGEEHAQVLFCRWLQFGTLEKPKARKPMQCVLALANTA